jgi:pimeloyl-ACP methyl ester carboxylesterase
VTTVASSDAVAMTMHHLAPAPRAARLLVAHATGFHARAYRPLARALDDRFDGWGLDSRGHGATPAPPGWTVDWRGFGDDAEAAATWLSGHVGTGGPGAELVGFGHSMGGAALLIAAHRNPQLFGSLALFEPIALPESGGLDAGESPLAIGARRRRRRFDSFAAAIAHYAARPPLDRFVPAALEEYVHGGFAPVDPAHPDGPVELTCLPEFEADTFAASSQSGVWDLLPAIDLPVLVIGGRPDGDSPPSLLAEPIAERLPQGRYQVDVELDHFGPFVDPARTADLIRAFTG